VVPPVRLPAGGAANAPGGELGAGFAPAADDVLCAWLEGVAAVRTGAARLADLGYIPGGMPQQRFAQQVRDEKDRWAVLIRKAGVKLE